MKDRHLWTPLALALLVACAPMVRFRTDVVVAAQHRPQHPLPPLVLTTQHTVFWDAPPRADRKSVRLARPAWKKALTLLGAPDAAGYVAVRLDGGIEVTGLARVADLGVMVCVPGPVGEQGYAGNGNLLQLSGVLAETTVQIADQVRVPLRPFAPGMRYGQQFSHVPLMGDVPRDRLCSTLPKSRHAGTLADPSVGHIDGEVDSEEFPSDAVLVDIPAGETLTLLDAPDGHPRLTRGAEPYGFVVVRVAQRTTASGAWDQIAVGGGPYLLGWVRARPPRGPEDGGLAMLGGVLGGSMHTPFALMSAPLAKLPLHMLPAGTVIQQYGQPFAVLKRDGWARASDLQDGWRYVTAAVDGDVTVEGWVRPDALRPAPTQVP